MSEDKITERALIRIRPDIDPEVMAFHTQTLSLRDYAEKRVIVEAGDLKVATEDLALISRLKKALEYARSVRAPTGTSQGIDQGIDDA